MKKFWELEPSDVQVKIKDQSHLDELFKMCELFGLEIDVDYYKSGYKWFRKTIAGNWYSNYCFYKDSTEVTTEQFYEILCHNYGYQAELKGFDKEVVLRMLECQEEQGNNRDIEVFENSYFSGFDWSSTKEGNDFWKDTIKNNKGKFPFQKPIHLKDEHYKILYHDLLEKFNQLKKIIN